MKELKHRVYSLELDKIIKPSERWVAENDNTQRWKTAKNSGTPTPTACKDSVIQEVDAVNIENLTEKEKKQSITKNAIRSLSKNI